MKGYFTTLLFILNNFLCLLYYLVLCELLLYTIFFYFFRSSPRWTLLCDFFLFTFISLLFLYTLFLSSSSPDRHLSHFIEPEIQKLIYPTIHSNISILFPACAKAPMCDVSSHNAFCTDYRVQSKAISGPIGGLVAYRPGDTIQ